MEETVKLVSPQGGSSLIGHSFVSTYQKCPRRWFLRYVLFIKERYIGKALSFGKAWHTAIEHYYRGEGEEAALRCGLEDLASSEPFYEYADDYTADLERFSRMFAEWLVSVGRPITTSYTILAVEEDMDVELPGGLRYTGRLDDILQHNESGAIFVGEHKSTSFSLEVMERTVAQSDQVTGYVAMWREKHPEDADRMLGGLLDVCYQKGSVTRARTSSLRFSHDDIARFWLNTQGLLSEMSQKVAAYESGVSDALLFPRNGHACSQFKCPYEAICRSYVNADTLLPDSLQRDPECHRYSPEERYGA